ncbi:MAG TPA: peroxiredoxin, partial [Pyrodictium sp.]|nr:peroxiredoxin [Pyrodictium sp.]
STEQEAKERLQKFKCFDWWFCYEDKASQEEKEQARSFLKRVANC